jgi:glycosyltransferase involved in cell wall biosynthesis
LLEDFQYSTPKPLVSPVNLVSIRNWESNYNLETVFEAVKILDSKFPGFFVSNFAGSGSQAEHLKTKYRDLIDRGIAIIHGHLSNRDVMNLISSSDIYVSASNSGGVSVSMLEAQAVGIPVIVSRIPTNQEWVVDGVTGLLFDHHHASDLAEVITRLVKGNLSSNLAVKAREQIESLADFRKNILQLIFP